MIESLRATVENGVYVAYGRSYKRSARRGKTYASKYEFRFTAVRDGQDLRVTEVGLYNEDVRDLTKFADNKLPRQINNRQ
jgi:hypothetical protein